MAFWTTKSVLFDGSTQYGTAGDVLGFEYNQTFSISAWFKTTDTVGFFASKKSDPAGFNRGYGFLLFAGTGTLSFFLTNDGVVAGTSEIRVDTTATFADGNWHHAVATWDGNATPGAGGVRIYVDGALATVSTVYNTLGTNTILNTASFNLAAKTDGGGGFLTGNLDEVAIYNKVLSIDEVLWIYNAKWASDLKHTNAPSNLVSWWRMGEDESGGLLPDQQGSNDVTLVGSPIVEEDAPVGASSYISGFYDESVFDSYFLSPVASYSVLYLPPPTEVTSVYSKRARDLGSNPPRYIEWITVDPDSSPPDPAPIGPWGEIVIIARQPVPGNTHRFK